MSLLDLGLVLEQERPIPSFTIECRRLRLVSDARRC
jgi:hypothetical protein